MKDEQARIDAFVAMATGIVSKACPGDGWNTIAEAAYGLAGYMLAISDRIAQERRESETR